MNLKRHMARHTIIKMEKVKERILKAVREKQSYIQGNPHWLSVNFSTTILQRRRKGSSMTFKVLKGKDLQPRIFYPARLSFRR